MIELTVVMDKLHDFETADDLAAFFHGYGVKARPKEARACAITKFVMEETGISTITTMAGYLHSFHVDDYGVEQKGEMFDHSPAMEQFVKMYDKGYYPFLVEEGFEVDVANEFLCCEVCG